MIHIHTSNATCMDHKCMICHDGSAYVNQAISSTAWTRCAMAFYSHSSPWQQEITLRADKLPFKGGFFFSSLTCHWLESFFFSHFILWWHCNYSIYPADFQPAFHVIYILLTWQLFPVSPFIFCPKMDRKQFFCLFFFFFYGKQVMCHGESMLLHPGNGCYPWQEGL